MPILPIALACVRGPARPRCTLALLCALLSIPPAGAAQPGVSFSDAIRLSSEQAPLLKARQARIAASRQDADRADALPDPQLVFGLANLPITGSDAYDTAADFMTMKQVGLRQAFPASAKRQAQKTVAEREVDDAEARSVAEEHMVHQTAAQAWIALWSAERQVVALTALREPAGIAVRTSKARLAGGGGTISEALTRQNAALALENRIDAARTAVAMARVGLARWLDCPAEDLETTGEPPSLTTLPAPRARLLDATDQQAPLRPWATREAVATAKVSAALAERQADWSLGVMYGQRERAPDRSYRSDMISVEVSMDLPAFTRNRQDREVAARGAELEAVAAEREEARRAQRETVARTLTAWDGLKRQVVRQESELLPLAHDRRRVALAAYAHGSDLQPWLEARNDELEWELAHARDLGELGQLWASLAYLFAAEETAP